MKKRLLQIEAACVNINQGSFRYYEFGTILLQIGYVTKTDILLQNVHHS